MSAAVQLSLIGILTVMAISGGAWLVFYLNRLPPSSGRHAAPAECLDIRDRLAGQR